MFLRSATLLTILFVGLSQSSSSQEKEKTPPLVLHVIRLKPGETRDLEMELPGGPFRPGTRDLAYVDTIPKPFSNEPGMSVWLNGSGYFSVSPSVEMRWQKSGISVRASKDAAAVTQNLRFRYASFLTGEHVVGLRVVVESK